MSGGDRLPPVKDGAARVEYRPIAPEGSSVGQRAFERVRQKSAQLAASVRAERDEAHSRHLLKEGGGSPRAASEDEKFQIATMMNQRMIQLFLDPQARSWYKLFCHMDDDLSGKVNFREFEDMVRNELKLPDSKLSHEQLRAVWQSLDEDSSGLISTGEFGQFMRKGEHVFAAEESLKAKTLKKKEAEGEAARAQHKELVSTLREAHSLADQAVLERTEQLRKAEAGSAAAALARWRRQNAEAAQRIRQTRVERVNRQKGGNTSTASKAASAQECEQFSILLNQRMVEIFKDPQARSWYKLFVHMDDDMSGKINFHELMDMVRNELKVPSSRFSEEQLRTVWAALDEDKSGLITSGEFGKFMKLGAHIHNVNETNFTKIMNARKAEGAATRQESKGLTEELKQLRAEDEATKRSRAAELHNVTWGLQAPSDARPLWRSPRAAVY